MTDYLLLRIPKILYKSFSKWLDGFNFFGRSKYKRAGNIINHRIAFFDLTFAAS